MPAVISVFELASGDQMATLHQLHKKTDFFLFRVSDVSLKYSLLSISTLLIQSYTRLATNTAKLATLNCEV